MYLDISSFQTFSAEKDKKKFKDAPGIRGPTKKGVRDENLSCRMAQKRSSIQKDRFYETHGKGPNFRVQACF